MITWSQPPGIILTVTRPDPTVLSISATLDIGEITSYAIVSKDVDFPETIILSVDNNGVNISGDSSYAIIKPRMDYNLNGTLGSADTIVDIPKDATLYLYHVSPLLSKTYSFSVAAYDDTIEYSEIFMIKVINSWDSNIVDINKILSKDY